MALAKGHSTKTKSQVSDIRTIGPLVLVTFEMKLSDIAVKMFWHDTGSINTVWLFLDGYKML